MALLQCRLPSQRLLYVIATTLFLYSFFSCHSQFDLHCTIARNLHRTMLIERHVTFHFVIWTARKRHSLHEFLRAVPGKFLGIVGQDPSDSKSNRLHVDIFRFCFHSFEVYSIDSSKMIGNSPEVSNFNRLNLKLNRFICN